MYTLQYKIADVQFRLRSDFAISSDKSWDLFADSAEKCDYFYECYMCEKMPEVSGRRYYDPIRERDYALCEELSDRMRIHLTRENLPWGSHISQLYPQLALPHVLLLRQKLVLHASYVLTQHGAIIFTAPSGTGKSTQAELWREHRNAFVVNGDRAVVAMNNDEVWAYGFPLSGSSNDCHNRSAKVLAIVSLQQAPENEVYRLSASEALTAIINGSYLPDEFAADLPLLIDAALRIAQTVRVVRLRCLPDKTALEALEAYLR